MPKKATTTKEAILEAAFQLVREQGEAALTVRKLAAFLGCSTQPVMYQFPDIKMLKELTYRRADAFHTAFILADADLLEIGLRYIRFAKEEPQLFRFLFQSGRFRGLGLRDLIKAPESSGILAAVCAEEALPPEEAAAFFEPLAALVHGYACLIADNAMEYDPEAVKSALIRAAEGLEKQRP